MLGIFGQRFADDSIELLKLRLFNSNERYRRRNVVQDAKKNCIEIVRGKRPNPAQQPVQHHTGRKQIAARIRFAGGEPFRRHEFRRAHDVAGRHGCRLKPGDSKIRDFDVVRFGQIDIGRFDIAMNDSEIMRVGQSFADLPNQIQFLRDRQIFRAFEIRQVAAFQQFHHDVWLLFGIIKFENCDDVGMRKSCNRARFFFEHGQELRIARCRTGNQLDGDIAVQPRIVSLVNSAHRAMSELLQHLILPDVHNLSPPSAFIISRNSGSSQRYNT